MHPPTKNDFDRHIYAVQRYCAITTPRYAPLMQDSLATHPIPCFGNPASAIAVTVGLNPSSAEFKPGRSWSATLTHSELAARCANYFSPQAPGPPRGWFQPWSEGLDRLDVSYQAGSAVHLDLSPRATRPVSALKAPAQQRLFLEMVERDLWILFATLQLCQNAKLILVAGSVTGEYYMNEFLQRFSPDCGYALDRPFSRTRQRGRGKTAWHCLRGAGRSLPVFFCSSGPSDGRDTMLPQRLEENADTLKQLLSRGGCSSLPPP